MLLSQLTNKSLFLNKTPRGVCRGVGVSAKNKGIKYLFCSTEENTEFVLPIAALASLSENALFLSRLRPVLPKTCTKLFLGIPVYSYEGKFLGELIDVEFQNYVATRFFTSQSGWFPAAIVSVISDAILLRKPQPYPLGQPIADENESVVTKQTLRTAIQKQSLIALTLSLPPFDYSL